MKLIKILCAAWCLFAGILLLSRWKKKNRKIKILAAKNIREIRPDTFRELNTTLCGQLMSQLALNDLRKTENYKNLSSVEWKDLKRKAFGKRTKILRRETTNVVGVTVKPSYE